VGSRFSCVRRAAGGVSCFGDNTFGQLGDGTTVSSGPPVSTAGLTGVLHLTTGGAHACVLRMGSDPTCWGQNRFGSLVDGTVAASPTPLLVPGL